MVHQFTIVYIGQYNTKGYPSPTISMVMNVSGANAIIYLKNVAPTHIGSGQDIEIILRGTGINPVEILVAPYSARNIHVKYQGRYPTWLFIMA